MLTHEEIRTHIHAFGLDEFADRILKSVKNAIHIGREQVEDEAIPIGASKLGGSPDVPPDFTWYTYQDTPLTFIGQFRLSEVAPHDVDHLLPERGMLYFFYEANGFPYEGDVSDATRVLYLPEEDVELRRFPHPTIELKDYCGKSYENGALPPSLATFSALTTIQDRLARLVSDDTLREQLWDRHYELYGNLMKLQGLNANRNDPPHHWLLGNPTVIQNDPIAHVMIDRVGVRSDFYLEAYEWLVKQGLLLAQFDSDFINVRPEWAWSWGDNGVLSFCMPKVELAARDFSKVRCEMNCY